MHNNPHPVHPLGTSAKILLSSVFGPFAQDDAFGSRKINPMELYHNQVTRVQGPFSLRIFHPTFGLLMLQANIDAPCTLLDFPRLEDFIREIEEHDYDIVGIGSIIPNVGKVKKMCAEIRRLRPNAQIVVGGHVANIPELRTMIDADQIVRGDGIRWFRRYLGQDEAAPVRHPVVNVRFGTRMLGLRMPDNENGQTVAAVIPSAGCPVGCNFCSTSAMFGGKGKFVNFYETGDALFAILCGIEARIGAQAFFVFDENFLLHRKRALRLLELMTEHRKAWSFYIFSSAKVVESYSLEQLIGLGIAWVWLGLEGRQSQYAKLKGIDTPALVARLQAHGIGVLGSTIVGLEEHTPENIDDAIDWAVSHATDFHQFMLYTPLPGTPLHAEHRANGSLLPESEKSLADIHGQARFNFRHPHINGGHETEYLLRAFQRDFEANGPSIARTIRTRLQGWLRYRDHRDPRIRKRYREHAQSLKGGYAYALWAMRKWFAQRDRVMAEKLARELQTLYAEFGWRTRLLTPLLGRVVHAAMKREARRLERGWTYEPATRYLKNQAALALANGANKKSSRKAEPILWVTAESNAAAGAIEKTESTVAAENC